MGGRSRPPILRSSGRASEKVAARGEPRSNRAMRWFVFAAFTFLATGCYVPAPRAKSCASCRSGARPASHATHVK